MTTRRQYTTLIAGQYQGSCYWQDDDIQVYPRTPLFPAALNRPVGPLKRRFEMIQPFHEVRLNHHVFEPRLVFSFGNQSRRKISNFLAAHLFHHLFELCF
ncbi:hypothetical protein SAMN05660226_00502 [Parapedobacter luteus]|uniref:Uncharacterized protein n=1 Tax=Parapedobacter luteus TaxID=623280 RepID=A0A1T5A2K3_9SPHI|nr:hypothetical protein SAMN05660226_00502 [Parapedobacter luteus]